ncbi:MAG: ABC transporter ATP-binding protein [Pseudomonadota bacterium]
MTPIEEPAAAEIVGLSIAFPSPRGPVRVVEEASFSVRRGEVLGLVGESGSGKSVTALALTGLLAMAGGRREAGRICLDGADVTDIPDAAWRKLRGSAVSMIFQDPLMSLNPVYRVGAQVAEALERHRWMSRRAAWRRAVELFDQVGLPDPEERARAFPHQLSGGMRQRVMIAMALACEPKLLIADEPTTALDVTIQATILELIESMIDRAVTVLPEPDSPTRPKDSAAPMAKETPSTAVRLPRFR